MTFSVLSPCCICGEEPDLNPGQMAMVPAAWAHLTCVQGFPGGIAEIAQMVTQQHDNGQVSHLRPLGGKVIQAWAGVPADEIWEIVPDTTAPVRYKITKEGLKRMSCQTTPPEEPPHA